MKKYCPTCHAVVSQEKNKDTYPFCSERCKLIDLGNWLSEAYKIPVKNDEIEDSALSEISVPEEKQ